MNLLRFCALCLVCFTLLACTSNDKPITRSLNTNDISRQQAAARAARLSDIRYQLHLSANGSQSFSSHNRISFTLTDTRTPLILNISKAQIDHLTINGHWLYPNYNGRWLTLNPKLLQAGDNVIEIKSRHQHGQDGSGWHRFVDPADQKIYLYSNFKPYAAQQAFALFDQPDIKARYQLTVTVPSHWHVVTTLLEQSIEEQISRNADGVRMNTWSFPETPSLSSEHFSVHAGPYQIWRDNHGKLPLRLFTRQSIAGHTEPTSWFAEAKNGLSFFEKYFAVDYPFPKYDQLFIPMLSDVHRTSAAVAAIPESYLLAPQQSFTAATTHQLAQQWLGNLVTTRWRNDTWFSASLATFFGLKASAHISRSNQAWVDFYYHDKQLALTLDQLRAIYPMATGPAADDTPAINASGVAALVQLEHHLGEQSFQQGVRQHLLQNRSAITEPTGFIDSLAQTVKQDLSQWTQQWLTQPGVNTLEVNLQCQHDRIKRLELIQHSANTRSAIFRPQTVQLALFKRGLKEMHLNRQHSVTYTGEVTQVNSLLGAPCPDIVYPNYQDWGYLNIQLDRNSLDQTKQYLNQIQDPLMRAMLWQSLWNSVLSGELAINEFLAAVFVNAPAESNIANLQLVLTRVVQARGLLATMTTSHQHYTIVATKGLQQMSLRKTMELQHQPQLQSLWFDTYIALADNLTSLEHLKQLLQGTASINGLEIDQSFRWKIVQQLNRYDTVSSQALLESEQRNDASTSGQRSALIAKILHPNANSKRRWLNQYLVGTMTHSDRRLVAQHLYPPEQHYLSFATAEQRLQGWETLTQELSQSMLMATYAQHLIPVGCDYASMTTLQQFMTQRQQAHHHDDRPLYNALLQTQQCITIKEKLYSSLAQ